MSDRASSAWHWELRRRDALTAHEIEKEDGSICQGVFDFIKALRFIEFLQLLDDTEEWLPSATVVFGVG